MKYHNSIKTLKAVSFALTLLLVSACGQGDKEQAQTTEKVQASVVQATAVERQPVALKLHYTALLEPKASNKIMAQTGGRIQQLKVEVGSAVSRGQVLALLDDTALSQAKVRLENASDNLERMDELLKVGAIARVQWEQASSEYTIAKAQLDNLSTNTALRSPMNGVVVARNYDEGDLSSPQLSIFVLEDLSELKAFVQVSEQYYAQLKEGLEAELSTDALEGEVFEARVSKVYPTVDPRTHTIRVELRINNKDRKLRSGMFARLSLNLGERETLLVTDRAVYKVMGSGSKYVYVLKNVAGEAVAEYREVQLGELYGHRYEVLAGLAEGERLIISSGAKLTDGEAVIIK